MQWNPDGRVEPGGDTGGDYQVTEAWSVRYIGQAYSDDGETVHPLVTVNFYAEHDADPECVNCERSGLDWAEHVDPHVPDAYKLVRQTEYMCCAGRPDPARELWRDYDHTVVAEMHCTLDVAEQTARAAADQHEASQISWDGHPRF